VIALIRKDPYRDSAYLVPDSGDQPLPGQQGAPEPLVPSCSGWVEGAILGTDLDYWFTT